MSLSPLNSALSSYLGTVQRPGTDAARGTAGQAPARAAEAPAQPARPAAPGFAAPAQSALPAQAPQGTDPELWSVLTTEERSFFAKVGTMGPLTYGRMLQTPNAPPSIRGGRLDIKV